MHRGVGRWLGCGDDSAGNVDAVIVERSRGEPAPPQAGDDGDGEDENS
jgi:hypothetical protein